MNSPLGWDGQRSLATLWFAAGQPLASARRDALLDDARALIDAGPVIAGVTSPADQVVVLRALAPRAEAAMALLQQVWGAWRQRAWGLAPCAPRVWRT